MRSSTVIGLLVLVSLPSQLFAAGKKFNAAIVERRVLRLTGTAAPEEMVVRVVASEKRVEVEYRRTDLGHKKRPERSSFPLTSFDRLDIDAGAGRDFVNIIDPEQTLDAMRKGLRIRGGDGDNVVAITAAPFAPETAARMRSLLDVTARIRKVAKQSSDATLAVMQTDAMKFAERVNTEILAEANAIAAQAEAEIFAPASDLVERRAAGALNGANAFVLGAERSELEHQKLVADLTRQLDPTGGEHPPDETGEPSEDPTGPEPFFEGKELRARARGEQAERFARELGDAAEREVRRAGVEIEQAANAIRARVDALEQRAARFAGTAARIGSGAETELTASAQRVLAIVAELRKLTPAFEEAARLVRDEIEGAQRTTTLALNVGTNAGTSCNAPSTTQTYQGGSGFDFFFPIQAPSDGWSIDGGGGFNILFGGFAADEIQGGSGTDVVFGLKGNDRIQGGDGVDLLVGEFILDLASITGDDCIRGEEGVDVVVGDNLIGRTSGTKGGNDSLEGGDGTDLIFGDDLTDFVDDALPGGEDDITGDGEIDLLFGCGGNDQIKGNDDIDLAVGNGGDDTIHGNDGRTVTILGTSIELGNLLIGSPGADEIHGGKGVDVLIGNGGLDRMWGGAQLDLMFGSAGVDEMRGEAGGVIFTIQGVPIRLGNLMLGGEGDDRMWGGGDLDVLLGEGGDDRVVGFDQAFYELAGIDIDVIIGGDGKDYLEGDDEYALLKSSNDFIFGLAGDDVLKGGSNRDFLFGGGGEDTIEGDSNALTLLLSLDLLVGGDGNDTMNGGNSLDVMLGLGGKDTMNGDNEAFGVVSPDLMFGGDDDDTLNGGSMIDLVFGNDGSDRITGDSNLLWQALSLDMLFGGPGDDEIHGGNALDFLFGQTGCDRMDGDTSIQGRISPDFLFGGPGDDFMDGGVNPDFMWGNAGQDTMFGDSDQGWMILSIDFMWGNEGCDTMSGGRSVDFMWGNADVDRMDGQSEPDLMIGGDHGDVMNGGDALDFLFGNGGNDTIHGDGFADVVDGGDGDDCVYGDSGPDIVVGGSGRDCVRGGAHPDLLSGGSGNDRVFGDGGIDLASGDSGDDEIDGGSGSDLLSGGSGSDEVWGGPGFDLMFGENKHQTTSSGLDCDCKPDRCEGPLCVRKFEDRNGNGKQEPDEKGLADWVFTVICAGCGGASTTLKTNANGDACVLVVPGMCSVTELLQTGWTPTTPTTQDAVITSNTQTTLSFGNRLPPDGEICIRKYHDFNANGLQDPGEPMVPGWTFDVNSATSTQATTGADGRVCVAKPDGTYKVVEQPRAGWVATTPTVQTVLVTSAQVLTVTFGNREERTTSRVCVFKFNDLNVNGVLDANEPPLSGWSFQLSGGSTVTTDASGSACIEKPAGPSFVLELPQDGWVATTPPVRLVTVIAGATSTEIFGNHYNPEHGTLCITSFSDGNRNGEQEGTEPGERSWVYDVTGQFSTPVFTGTDGTVCTSVDAGRYTVFERTQWSYEATTPVEQSAFVRNGQTVTLKFGHRAIEQFLEGRLCITKFEDRNGDAVQNVGEPGLPGWDFHVTGAGQTITVTTGANGQACPTLKWTTYLVEEQPKSGWIPVTPPRQTILLRHDPELKFGNRRATSATASVCVYKFNDRDGDGRFNPAIDILLPNWTFTVNNGTLPPILGGTCQAYPEGIYTFTELAQPGWLPTTSPSQMITVVGGVPMTLYFGNYSP